MITFNYLESLDQKALQAAYDGKINQAMSTRAALPRSTYLTEAKIILDYMAAKAESDRGDRMESLTAVQKDIAVSLQMMTIVMLLFSYMTLIAVVIYKG